MIALLFTLLVGCVFGMRLRVFSLLPAIAIFIIALGGIGGARHIEFGTLTLYLLAGITCLQMGYLIGSASRFFVAAARVPSRSSVSNAQAQKSAS